MSDEPSTPATQSVNIPPHVNVTGVQVAGGSWALHLVFTTSAVPAPQQLIETPSVVVGMSWPLAKALHQILAQTLAEYEGGEGTIALPRSFVEARAKLEADVRAKNASG